MSLSFSKWPENSYSIAKCFFFSWEGSRKCKNLSHILFYYNDTTIICIFFCNYSPDWYVSAPGSYFRILAWTYYYKTPLHQIYILNIGFFFHSCSLYNWWGMQFVLRCLTDGVSSMFLCIDFLFEKWIGLFAMDPLYQIYILTGGELRNGLNGFLTSYATDSVRFSQQILDI